MLVLAVERQQRDRHLAQVADRRGAPAQVGPRAPLGAHAPGEHDLLGVGGQPLAQLAAQRRRQLEDPFDVGLRRPRAHDPGARAAAQQEVERVGEHRLARARLAGEHVETRGEAQLGPFDEEEVLDAQLQEHVRACTSAHRRTGRLRPLPAHFRCNRVRMSRTPCGAGRQWRDALAAMRGRAASESRSLTLCGGARRCFVEPLRLGLGKRVQTEAVRDSRAPGATASFRLTLPSLALAAHRRATKRGRPYRRGLLRAQPAPARSASRRPARRRPPAPCAARRGTRRAPPPRRRG